MRATLWSRCSSATHASVISPMSPDTITTSTLAASVSMAGSAGSATVAAAPTLSASMTELYRVAPPGRLPLLAVAALSYKGRQPAKPATHCQTRGPIGGCPRRRSLWRRRLRPHGGRDATQPASAQDHYELLPVALECLDLHRQPQHGSAVNEQLEEGRWRPDVEVDRVALRFEFGGSQLDLAGCHFLDEPSPFLVVCVARTHGPVLVVASYVRERRQCPVAVERHPGVRHGHVEDAAGPEHAQVVGKRADRVLTVLDHVIGDHEVDRSVADAGERLTVLDQVWAHEVEVLELGVVRACLGYPEPIDIADGGVGGQLEGHVQGPDLEADASEVLRCEASAHAKPAPFTRPGGGVGGSAQRTLRNLSPTCSW